MIWINQRLVDRTGEPHRLLSEDLLQSACARPKNRWAYEPSVDLATLASALLSGIGRNHPFAQGNKRTAFVAGVAFVELNGGRFTAPDSRLTSQQIIDLVEGALSEAAFAEWLAGYVRVARED